MRGYIGAKYERNRDITDIAKLVRTDIKAAIKKGGLPRGTKVSVRVSRYAGGQSLDACIKSLGKKQAMNPDFVRWEKNNPHAPFQNAPQRYTKAACAAIMAVENIIRPYNYDHSEPETDYYNVNFYAHVKIDYNLTKSECAAILAETGNNEEPAPKPQAKKQAVQYGAAYPIFAQRHTYWC